MILDHNFIKVIDKSGRNKGVLVGWDRTLMDMFYIVLFCGKKSLIFLKCNLNAPGYSKCAFSVLVSILTNKIVHIRHI